MLISRFKTCSHEVKVKLFKSFLSNAYGCHWWTKHKQCMFKRVVVAYNNIYRKLFGIKRGESMSAIYVQNSIDFIGVLMRTSIYGFRKRVNSSDKMLLQCVSSSLYFYHASSISPSHLASDGEKTATLPISLVLITLKVPL